jgi:hypothetical protein
MFLKDQMKTFVGSRRFRTQQNQTLFYVCGMQLGVLGLIRWAGFEKQEMHTTYS